MSLADKIRKSRETTVEDGKHKFIVRRPTDLEMLKFAQTSDPADLLRFVVGWEGVTELDLYPGGGPEPAPFDAEACREWVGDRIETFGKITDAVMTAYEAHQKAQGIAEKN
jgi:hypothetical protein